MSEQEIEIMENEQEIEFLRAYFPYLYRLWWESGLKG